MKIRTNAVSIIDVVVTHTRVNVELVRISRVELRRRQRPPKVAIPISILIALT